MAEAERQRATDQPAQYQIDPHSERMLNEIIASEVMLYFKVKKAHWLATGPHFKEVHELLDEHSEDINSSIDHIAERIVMCRGTPVATLDEFQKDSQIEEFWSDNQEDRLMDLANNHEMLGRRMAECIIHLKDDPGTVDVLTKFIRKHEKASWYLRQMSGVQQGQQYGGGQETIPFPGTGGMSRGSNMDQSGNMAAAAKKS